MPKVVVVVWCVCVVVCVECGGVGVGVRFDVTLKHGCLSNKPTSCT